MSADGTVRSNRPDVRNPVLALAGFRRLQEVLAQDYTTRVAMQGALLDLAADARDRAEKCWRKHKAPMAAYWKAVAVYAKHTARAIK